MTWLPVATTIGCPSCAAHAFELCHGPEICPARVVAYQEAAGKLRSVFPENFGSELVTSTDRPTRWGPTLLYRFYDANCDLLYVGVTGRPDERFTAHRRNARWWNEIAFLDTEMLPSMYEALRAEREAIHAESPIHNRRSAA